MKNDKQYFEDNIQSNQSHLEILDKITDKCIRWTKNHKTDDGLVLTLNQYTIREHFALYLAKLKLEEYDNVLILFKSKMLLEQMEELANECNIDVSVFNKYLNENCIQLITNIRYLRNYEDFKNKNVLVIDINASYNHNKVNKILLNKKVIRFMNTYEYTKSQSSFSRFAHMNLNMKVK